MRRRIPEPISLAPDTIIKTKNGSGAEILEAGNMTQMVGVLQQLVASAAEGTTRWVRGRRGEAEECCGADSLFTDADSHITVLRAALV